MNNCPKCGAADYYVSPFSGPSCSNHNCPFPSEESVPPTFSWAGYKEWRVDGQRHRLDGPALIRPGEGRFWFYEDKLHRLDGPAIEYADGSKFWYVDGKLHRLDGPAIECASGSKEWWVDGKLHRVGGPARMLWNGLADELREWYYQGKLNRLDGPAREWANGKTEWYVNGKQVPEPEEDGVIILGPNAALGIIRFNTDEVEGMPDQLLPLFASSSDETS